MIEGTVLHVVDEPFCIWEHAQEKRNLRFLDGIDPEYFRFAAEHLSKESINDDDLLRAATLLRTTYHHGVETLFSVLGAAVQAPDCVFGWMSLCKTEGLRTVVRQISEENFSLPKRVTLDPVTWETISQAIHGGLAVDSDAKNEVAGQFAMLWKSLAQSFLDENGISEYNSLKHGFRIRQGGFKIEIGVPDPTERGHNAKELVDLGGSKFGASFLSLEKVGGKDRKNRSHRILQHSINWSDTQTASLLHLISASIANAVAALKLTNGVSADKVAYVIPSIEDFESAQEMYVGPISFSLQRRMPDEDSMATTKEQLLKHLYHGSGES